MHRVLSSLLMILILFSLTDCAEKKKSYQGYIDAEYRFIASDYAGVLVERPIYRGDTIKKGDKLFVLEKFPQVSDVSQVEAKIVASKAAIDQYTAQIKTALNKLNRRKELAKRQFAHQEDVDNALNEYLAINAHLEQARAELKSNEALLEQAKWSMNKKEINAVLDAMVFDTFYNPGEYVPSGRPILSLIAPQDIKIIFFVPEVIVGKLKIKEPVKIYCDGCHNPIQGSITYISPTAEYSPPVIFSDQTRDKLVFSIEARTDGANSKNLHPGQPVSVLLE